MVKKELIKYGITIFCTAIISLCIYFFVSKMLFSVAFVVIQDSQNTISTYELCRGKIISSTSNGISFLKFDLNSVYNNRDAIKLIEEQVRKSDGTIIAIHQ